MADQANIMNMLQSNAAEMGPFAHDNRFTVFFVRFTQSCGVQRRHQDDAGKIHQGPMEGIDNWFYARVRNRGSSIAQHFMVTFTIKPWAGTEFVYPADFIPCTAATGGFELEPDEEIIVSVKWPAASVPPAGTHACLLA